MKMSLTRSYWNVLIFDISKSRFALHSAKLPSISPESFDQRLAITSASHTFAPSRIWPTSSRSLSRADAAWPSAFSYMDNLISAKLLTSSTGRSSFMSAPAFIRTSWWSMSSSHAGVSFGCSLTRRVSSMDFSLSGSLSPAPSSSDDSESISSLSAARDFFPSMDR